MRGSAEDKAAVLRWFTFQSRRGRERQQTRQPASTEIIWLQEQWLVRTLMAGRFHLARGTEWQEAAYLGGLRVPTGGRSVTAEKVSLPCARNRRLQWLESPEQDGGVGEESQGRQPVCRTCKARAENLHREKCLNRKVSCWDGHFPQNSPWLPCREQLTEHSRNQEGQIGRGCSRSPNKNCSLAHEQDDSHDDGEIGERKVIANATPFYIRDFSIQRVQYPWGSRHQAIKLLETTSCFVLFFF